MRKSDLVSSVADATGLAPRQADDVVFALLEQVTNALSRGESVSLVGFGSFVVRARAARQGRNPQTGEPIAVAASKQVIFRPGKPLKDAVT